MFVSFFPRPRLFFPSSILWTALAMAVWYGFASNLFQAPGKAGWAGDVLVGAGAVVRSLFCAWPLRSSRLHGCYLPRIPGRRGPFLAPR